MDQHFHQFTESLVNDYGFNDESAFQRPAQSLEEWQSFNLLESNTFRFEDGTIFPSLEQLSEADNFAPFYNVSSVVDFPDDHEFYPVLKYLNQIVMEEEPTVCNDPLALQATEKSLYEVLGKDLPSLPHESLPEIDESLKGSGFSDLVNLVTSSSSASPVDSISGAEPYVPSPLDAEPSLASKEMYGPLHSSFESPLDIGESGSLNPLVNSFNCSDGLVDSFASSSIISSMFSDGETMSQYKKGLEEGSKFLMKSTQFVSPFDSKQQPLTQEKEAFNLVSDFNKDEGVQYTACLSGKKHRHLDYSTVNSERSIKQSAIYQDELEMAEIFDKILLNEVNNKYQLRSLNLESPGGKNILKKRGTDAKAVDLIALLISCSQSIGTNDIRAATEQLKVIKQHASSTGNSYQRLAVPFVKGLEARLEGTGSELYANLISKRVACAEELKAFRVYLSAPFKQMYCFFANSMILEAASKGTTLHIVDFGISYGFQWPSLIKQLSERPGGPPKLRISGIDLPESGFRPSEHLEVTGRRLAEYCRRFEVPFEYHAIASSNWDKIDIEDLKITRNEVLAVNCQWRFKSILDETADGECPRDDVLNLIKEMKPDIFVHDVINGQFGSPFFATRFREAILFFSTIFDLLEYNLPRHDPHRMKYESDYIGPDIVNIVACEGRARVDRPETYKQWHIRYTRAGFKLLPLNKTLMKELRVKVKEGYHKDFMFDEDGCWMILGWKGKIITASSCLVPA